MNLIVAVDKEWGIGYKGDLLARVKGDLGNFAKLTTGKIVVLGSNTLATFPGGRVLKNRTNIVFHRGNEVYEGCIVVKDTADLKKVLDDYNADDVFVIGGGSIYKLLLEYCSHALVTKVDADGDATVFYPNLDENEEWECVKESEQLESNGYTFKFTTYKNNNIKILR